MTVRARMLWTLLASLATLACPCVARAQVYDSATEAHIRRYGDTGLAGLTRADSLAAMRFVRALQAAVAREDRRAVARMVSYPLRAWDGRRSRLVRGPGELMALYPRLFTPSLRRDIAAVTIDSLFANWQGVMFATGRVWFIRPADGRPYEIITINRPMDRRPPPRQRNPR